MNPYPAGTMFRVLKPCAEFPNDFEVVEATSWVNTLKPLGTQGSFGETFVLSPLVIGERLRSKHIEVLQYPAHPSHDMQHASIGGQGTEFIPAQCSRCMLQETEGQIIYPCALGVTTTPQPGPALDVKDGPGPSSRNHPWRK